MHSPFRVGSSLIVLLLLAGFLGISLLWWVGPHDSHTGGCIAALAQNGDCPNALSSANAVFHSGVIKHVLQIFPTAVAALALAWALFWWFKRMGLHDLITQDIQRVGWLNDRALQPIPVRPALRSWLALHEDSPARDH